MITDLTQGNIHKRLWLFSLPMLVSVIFQQIYNIADSMIAGKFVGEDALSAVGASYPVTMIFMAVAMGCNIGCAVVISNLFGAKRYGEMKTAISTTIIASLALSVLLTALGLALSVPIMRLIQTPDNIFSDAILYLNIYIGGLVFLFLYNVCTGIFTSLGDSRTPLYFLIGSSVGNIILDLVFVIVFRMGVGGVAWATFLAQGVACVLSLITLWRRVGRVETTEESHRFSWPMLGRISRIAVPSILQQSFVSVGNICIQGLVNSCGSSVIAGYSAAVKLNTFAITAFTTLANGLSSFTAQNLGAQKWERVTKGFRSGCLMALLVVLPFTLFYFFFHTTAVELFLNAESDQALQTGSAFLRMVAPFYAVIAIKLMADGVLRGAGSMMHFMVATFTDLILRVVLAFVLFPVWGTDGIWLSWPIGWTAATILSCLFYRFGAWRKPAVQEEPSLPAGTEE